MPKVPALGQLDLPTRTAFLGMKDYTDQSLAAVTAGFRNVIINGSFDIWQRGTSFAAGGYNADRWQTGAGTSTFVTSRQAFALGNVIPGQEFEYFHRTVVTSVANANAFVIVSQWVESVRVLAGRQAVVSFWAKADAAKPIAIEISQVFGTGGSPSATANLYAGQVNLTTTWSRYEVAFTMPSIAGKTLGTGRNDAVVVNFWLDSGSAFNSRTGSLGQRSGTYDFAGVQMEAGSKATPYEVRPLAVELPMCERYFKSYSGNRFGLGQSFGAAAFFTLMMFQTQMRAAPSFASGGSFFATNNVGGNVAVTGLTLATSDPWGAQLNGTVAAGLTAGDVCMLYNNASAVLQFSAEL